MTPHGPRRPARIFVAAIVLAGSASLALALALTWERGVGDLRILAFAAGALSLLGAFPIVFEWKGETENINLEEAFFALLIMTSPPAAVLAAMMFATVVTNVYRRLSLVKASFNFGLFGLAVSLGVGVTRLVAGAVPAGSDWRGITGVFAGATTMYIGTTMGVRAIVAISDRLAYRQMFVRMSAMEALILPSSCSLGVLAGMASAQRTLSVVFLIPPLTVVVFVLHQHARAVADRRQLDLLLATAVAASQATSTPAVREVLVEATETLLHTTEARIQIGPPLDDELGSRVQAGERAQWLVARPRSGPKRIRAAEQTLLDGIAAIGSGALESAELLDRVRHQAFHDGLTGLPNRLLFEDRVNQALRRRDRHAAAVLFVDLDLFKRVNDSLGHRAGDTLLQLAALRVQSSLRSSDSAARLGGDEFAVLLPEVEGEHVALEVALRINQAMRDPFLVEDQELTMTASVGIALSPVDGEDYETLLRSADLAMYDAKAAGRDTARRSYPKARRGGGMALETDLRHAIERDELWVAYQPQIDLVSSRIVGTEALVRWAHPARGQLRPDEFLPLAEELGLLGAIDEWVVQQACRQTASWRAGGIPELRAAVNLSGGSVRSHTLHDFILATLRRAGLPTAALEIEVTERVAATDGEAGLESLAQLRAAGVRVSIDDFGTGYSSLSRLRTLPVDVVKIDQSFVREIVDSTSAAPLVTSAIAMAHGLGLEVIAEGIETTHQLSFLIGRGCEMGQGYLFGRPVPADQLRPERELWMPPPVDPVPIR